MRSRQEILDEAGAVLAAIAVHVLVAALVVLGTMDWKPFKQRKPQAIAIEAVIVDTAEIKRQREAARKAAEREQLRQQRAAELERQKQRERQEREAKARREKELEARRKREAEDRLKQLRLERQRKLEEQRLKQQRELEKIRAQREAAERQRKLEEERLKQIEARREREKQEQLRRQQEAEKQRKAAEQERAFQAGRQAELQDQYVAAIQSFVTQNWLRPPTARPGLNCKVKVVQIPGGEVISASIVGACNADEATKRSIIAAVERGGALPYRGFEDVFAREITFDFTYDGE